jgi:hypothetical protein
MCSKKRLSRSRFVEKKPVMFVTVRGVGVVANRPPVPPVEEAGLFVWLRGFSPFLPLVLSVMERGVLSVIPVPVVGVRER